MLQRAAVDCAVFSTTLHKSLDVKCLPPPEQLSRYHVDVAAYIMEKAMARGRPARDAGA